MSEFHALNYAAFEFRDFERQHREKARQFEMHMQSKEAKASLKKAERNRLAAEVCEAAMRRTVRGRWQVVKDGLKLLLPRTLRQAQREDPDTYQYFARSRAKDEK